MNDGHDMRTAVYVQRMLGPGFRTRGASLFAADMSASLHNRTLHQ
jgi:hypothetical protein